MTVPLRELQPGDHVMHHVGVMVCVRGMVVMQEHLSEQCCGKGRRASRDMTASLLTDRVSSLQRREGDNCIDCDMVVPRFFDPAATLV